MINTLRIKRRASGAPGAPASLANAELAYNEVDDVLYYDKGTGGEGDTTTTIPAIGGIDAFLSLSGNKTVSGDKTFTGDVVVPTQASSDDSTKAASTAFVKAQNYLTRNQSITISGDATASGSTSITLTLANSGITAGTYHKLTINAKGLATAGASLATEDIPSLAASKISDLAAVMQVYRMDQFAAPTAEVFLNSHKLTCLADPTAAQDAATKAYVDATRQDLDVKDSVRAATTAAITLNGTPTIDGVALDAGTACWSRTSARAQRTASMSLYPVVPGPALATSSPSTAAASDLPVITLLHSSS